MDNINDGMGQVRVNPTELPNEKCEKCGNVYFSEKYIMKRVSKLLIGAPEDQFVPINILVCDKCGEPHSQYKELFKNDKDQEKKSLLI